MNQAARFAVSDVARAWVRGWDSRSTAVSAAYLLLYILLDWVTYVQPVLKLGITPWNPQAGLTLAYLVLFGPRYLVVTALGAALSEVLVRDASLLSPAVPLASAWIALSYASLAAVLRKWKLVGAISTPSACARLTGASLMGTMVVASGYVLLFTAAGDLPRTDAVGSLARYWLSDLTGIVTLTPLLLQASRWREGLRAMRGRAWEVLAQLAAILITLWVLFGLAVIDELRVFYPLFVPTIWIALRWGLPGALLGPLSIQIGLIILLQDHSRGPPLLDLQFLMLTLSLTALMLGAFVTERAEVLRRVAMREAEQRALFAVAPDAVLAVDESGRVRVANPAALKLFGDRAGNDPPLTALLPGLILGTPEGRASLEGRLADGATFPAEIAWARLDSPESEGFLVTVRDVSERRRADAQLRERDTALARAMRFAVAGELASALAHELNQPITALVSYLRASEILAAPFGHQDDRIKATLGKAAQEAIRASEVLRRLRDFYRGGSIKRESVHLPSLCSTVSTAFQDRLRRANTALIVRMDPDLPTVEGDSTQIEIVLHNLVSNAIDALTQVARPWRRIEISATREEASVVLQVADSGPGINPEIMQKLFEPFTTSKSDGMGLGLAISRSLIRARGGDLTLQPQGRLGGACFIVRLMLKMPQDALT